MFFHDKINKTIHNCILYIKDKQLLNGGFFSLSSFDPDIFSDARIYHTTFLPSFILSILATLEDSPEVNEVKRKAVDFLMLQRSENWSYNYWDRNSPEARSMPYPDDLDDTFCALSALKLYDKDMIDGQALAKIVSILTAVEEKESGPYRTWLVNRDSPEIWCDIDLAVNSNVAYFLSLQDVFLDGLNDFIEDAIASNKYESPYYPTIYPIIYFISRFYRGGKAKNIIEFILSKGYPDSSWGNILNTSLAISSLINFGYPPELLENSIIHLLDYQERANRPYAFCIDPARDGKIFYAGSASLTVAFYIEALNKYLKAAVDNSKNNQIAKESDFDEDQKKIFKMISSKVHDRLSSVGSDLQRSGLEIFNKTIEKDKKGEITLLPYFFMESLGEKREAVDSDLVVALCSANIYGWMAYTIYDDFLDGEGDPAFLSAANLFLRELSEIYQPLLPETGLKVFFQTTMEGIDNSNLWEVTNCGLKRNENGFEVGRTMPNYGDYSKLYEKSFGHGLGPIAILFSLGYKEDSFEVKELISFFKNYLLARQLNDDMHDWEEDLKNGRVNCVGSEILEKWREKKGISETMILREEDVPDLQQLFWIEMAVGMCKKINNYVAQAKMHLAQIELIKEPALLYKFLEPLDHAANQALKEREEALKFLSAYKPD